MTEIAGEDTRDPNKNRGQPRGVASKPEIQFGLALGGVLLLYTVRWELRQTERKRDRKKMSEVLPFRGIRYNRDKIDNMWNVISPPWDKINPDKAEQLRKQHLNNIVHLLVEGKARVSVPWPDSARRRRRGRNNP